jgi:hypothetical protein
LSARLASREWYRCASDDDLWRGFFGALLSTFPAVSTWPTRGAIESCARWYFRCRAYARFAQGAGEAYHNGHFPHLRMLGTLHGNGAQLSFRPDEPLSFPVAYGVLWCRVRARMAGAGGCLSEHVELVNFGVADRSRGLQTVRLSRTWFSTVPHVYVTVDQCCVYLLSLTFSHTSKYKSTFTGGTRSRRAVTASVGRRPTL